VPVETWFPTVVWYQDLTLEPALREDALAAVLERADAAGLEAGSGLTASNAPNDLHHDPRIAALFERLRESLREFLFEELHFDRTKVEFHLGRCWPVVQGAEGEGGGGMHVHRGASFSGVFYLRAPEGAGGLELESPVEWLHDGLEKTALGPLTFRQVTYPAVEGRLIVFPSSLRHRRLPGATGRAGRVALAFDLYTTTALEVPGAGLPRLAHLRKLL
jgi:uncharacterized protein (TIGR02466 family)